MADTTFVSKTTPIPTAWLQDLNDLFYKGTKALTVTSLKTPIVDSGTTGNIDLKTNNGTRQLQVAHVASAVNFVQIAGRATGLAPLIGSLGSDTDVGLQIYSQGAGTITFQTATSTVNQFQILHTALASRNITVTGSVAGNPIISTTGGNLQVGTVLDLGSTGQIQFPATFNPSAGANVLDDYEELTWTPAIAFGGSSVGVTYTLQEGRYTKIGRLVVASWNLILSNKGAAAGSVTITGLPFTASGAATAVNAVSAVQWVALATTQLNVTTSVNPGGTNMFVQGIAVASTGNVTVLQNTDISNTTNLLGTVAYYT